MEKDRNESADPTAGSPAPDQESTSAPTESPAASPAAPRTQQASDPVPEPAQPGPSPVTPPSPPAQEPPVSILLKTCDDAANVIVSALKSTAHSAAASLQHIAADPLALAHWMQSGFNRLRPLIPASAYDTIRKRTRTLGQLALLAGAIIAPLFGVFAAVSTSNWAYLPLGIALALLFPVLQSATHHAWNRLTALPLSTHAPVSRKFLDTLAILSEITGLLLFAFSILAATHGSAPALVLAGLAWWCLFDTICYVFMHPEVAGLVTLPDEHDDFSPAGIPAAIGRVCTSAIPVAFGLGCSVCAVGAFVGILSIVAGGAPSGTIACLLNMALFGAMPLITIIAQKQRAP